MNYVKGITWMDDCRIPLQKSEIYEIRRYYRYSDAFSSYQGTDGEKMGYSVQLRNEHHLGRFCPNLLVCDDVLNDGKISSIKQNKNYEPPNDAESVAGCSVGRYIGICDMGTNSRYYDLDSWFDNLIFKLT